MHVKNNIVLLLLAALIPMPFASAQQAKNYIPALAWGAAASAAIIGIIGAGKSIVKYRNLKKELCAIREKADSWKSIKKTIDEAVYTSSKPAAQRLQTLIDNKCLLQSCIDLEKKNQKTAKMWGGWGVSCDNKISWESLFETDAGHVVKGENKEYIKEFADIYLSSHSHPTGICEKQSLIHEKFPDTYIKDFTRNKNHRIGKHFYARRFLTNWHYISTTMENREDEQEKIIRRQKKNMTQWITFGSITTVGACIALLNEYIKKYQLSSKN
jgi:hypothetical protein